MRTTSSFDIFPDEPSERELARARWLRSEGRFRETEDAYRAAITANPKLRTAWTEYFELLRSSGKVDHALALATEASRIFSNAAFPLALQGAALIEQGKFRPALRALEEAVTRDPDLALTWHELGHAAYKLGEGSRALLALDRAFALEPHTETLVLRGKIFRDAGELYAAEVAFEAAAHSASHENQRAAVAEEIRITHRLGGFPPKWVREHTTSEEWFAKYGTTVLGSAPADTIPTEAQLVDAFIGLAADRGWHFDQIVGIEKSLIWERAAHQLGAAVIHTDDYPGGDTPLLATVRPAPDHPGWRRVYDTIGDTGRGASFTMWHPVEVVPETDIVGALEENGQPLPLAPDPANALVMAQHPAATIYSRKLNQPAPVSQIQ